MAILLVCRLSFFLHPLHTTTLGHPAATDSWYCSTAVGVWLLRRTKRWEVSTQAAFVVPPLQQAVQHDLLALLYMLLGVQCTWISCMSAQ
jgi:hypothetical protein